MPRVKVKAKMSEEEDVRFNVEDRFKYDGKMLTLDTTTYIGRMCGRLFGYLIWSAGDKGVADKVFKKVGK